MKQEIENALLEAVWLTRWTDENKQSMYAVLESEEAIQMVKDIVKELSKAGYKIVKKQKRKPKQHESIGVLRGKDAENFMNTMIEREEYLKTHPVR